MWLRESPSLCWLVVLARIVRGRLEPRIFELDEPRGEATDTVAPATEDSLLGISVTCAYQQRAS